MLVGSTKLATALEELGLIDEYVLVLHPVFAGHGPTLFPGVGRSRRVDLIGTSRLASGVLALHHRRREG